MGIVIAVIVVVVLVAVVGAVLAAAQRKRRAALQEQFGGEYDRAVEAKGGRREGESELRERLEERKTLDIRPLAPESREAFATEWQRVQAEFVDAPQSALAEADVLVHRVMRERGYPMDDFEHQASLISVDHPEVVTNYRNAHESYVRSAQGDAETEQQRQGLLHYRALFDELLGDEQPREESRR
ncbi:MAG: hypothetical protein NVSMB4_04030 [Acidimicrobiales bacterium]